MYFSKLLLKDFGKFHNREINLKPGVNVVYGTRNAGKSTVADFEYATLYGIGTFPESACPRIRSSEKTLRLP